MSKVQNVEVGRYTEATAQTCGFAGWIDAGKFITFIDLNGAPHVYVRTNQPVVVGRIK